MNIEWHVCGYFFPLGVAEKSFKIRSIPIFGRRLKLRKYSKLDGQVSYYKDLLLQLIMMRDKAFLNPLPATYELSLLTIQTPLSTQSSRQNKRLATIPALLLLFKLILQWPAVNQATIKVITGVIARFYCISDWNQPETTFMSEQRSQDSYVSASYTEDFSVFFLYNFKIDCCCHYNSNGTLLSLVTEMFSFPLDKKLPISKIIQWNSHKIYCWH